MTEQDQIPTTTATTATTAGTPYAAAAAFTANGPAYAGPAPTPDAATMAMLAHILDFTVLGPLIIYLVKKDSHPFVADQSREALNFSITYFIAAVVVNIVVGILTHVALIFAVLYLISLGLLVVVLIMGIMAGMKAKTGVAYRYPFAVRLVK